MTSPMTALAAATTFFETVYATAPEDTAVRVMRPPAWRPEVIAARDGRTAAQVALDLSPDVYVGCGLYAAAEPAPTRRGTANDVVVLTALWCDLDIEKPGTKKRYVPDRPSASRFIAALPIRPTVIIWTGGGFHLWWCLREPLVLDTSVDRAQAERLVRRWQAYLRQRLDGYALDATHDLARVLRVPGTINSKYKTPVVLEDAGGPRVDPSELEDLCIGVPGVERTMRSGTSSLSVTLDPDAEPPFGKFAALCRTSPIFGRLWRRELAPIDNSQSGFDCRLATLAAGAGWTDSEIVGLLIAHRRAGGGPPKLRPDYYARTLARARASTGTVTVSTQQGAAEHRALHVHREAPAPGPMPSNVRRT
jgi:hypothetical protein